MISDKVPVFIVGTPRSGTTLVRLVLDSHPSIAITPESSFLFRAGRIWNRIYGDKLNEKKVGAFIKDLNSLPQVRDWLPSTCTPERVIEQCHGDFSWGSVLNCVFDLYAESRQKPRWGDKTPKNLYAVEDIFAKFPDAKIVVVVRDCRDVVMSMQNADFSRSTHVLAALRWQKDAERGRELIEKYGDRVFILKYEDLLENPEKEIKTTLEYCGLDNDPSILKRYMAHEDDVAHTKSDLYMKPISPSNLNKWKTSMPDKIISDCEAIAGNGLRYFGYETRFDNPSISATRLRALQFKGGWSLFRNRKYMENYRALLLILLRWVRRRISG